MSAPPLVLVTVEQTQDPVVTTVLTRCVASQDRLATARRRQPMQGDTGFLTLETPNTVGSQEMGGRLPQLGPKPPVVVDPLPTQQQQTITTRLTGTRPRKTTVRLNPPTVLASPPTQQQQTIAAKLVAVVQRRMIRLHGGFGVESKLEPPFPVDQSPPLMRVSLMGWIVQPPARQPGRAPRSKLFPPATLVAAATLAPPLAAKLIRTRPRPVRSRLNPPTALQTFQGPTVKLVRTRPRPVRSRLSAPTVLATFQGPTTHLTRIRPRPTIVLLSAPTVIRVPAVEQQQQTIRVQLVRIRPRKTEIRLTPPTVLQTFAEGTVRLVRTRPRPTIARVDPPTVVRVPSVEQRQQTITTKLVRIRPPGTVARLSPPTVLATFQTGAVKLVRTRPRPTTHRLQAPTVIRIPSVEQRQQTITTRLVQTRPRNTLIRLAPPTVLAVFDGPSTKPVRTRPRRTRYWLTAVSYAATSTIQVTTVRVRPRKTSWRLAPPAVVTPRFVIDRLRVVQAPAIPRGRFDIRSALNAPIVLDVFAGPIVKLIRTRPRPIRSKLHGPTVIQPFTSPFPPIKVYLVAVADRITRLRRTPLSKLFPPGPTRQKGIGCLIDVPAVIGCLKDLMASVACLLDRKAAIGCLEDEDAAVGCVDDLAAAQGKLRDQEG